MGVISLLLESSLGKVALQRCPAGTREENGAGSGMLRSVSASGAVAESSAPDPQRLSPAGSRGPGEAVPELPGLSLALFPPSPPRPPPRRSLRPGPHQNMPLYKRSQQPSGAESATNPNGQQAHEAGVPSPRERAARASPTGSPPSQHPNDVPKCPASPPQTPRGCCSPASRDPILEEDSKKRPSLRDGRVAWGHQAIRQQRGEG